MFSLFIREKVCVEVGFYPDLHILTIAIHSFILAKLAGPFSLASSSVSQLFSVRSVLRQVRFRSASACIWLGVEPWLVRQGFRRPLTRALR